MLLESVEIGNDVRFAEDRKSTRLNSSHSQISYAVFCLKKKKINISVLVLVEIIVVHRSCQAQKIICPILAHESLYTSFDQLSSHSLATGDSTSTHIVY